MTEDHRADIPTADNVTDVPLVSDDVDRSDRVDAMPRSGASGGDRPPTGRARPLAIGAAATAALAVMAFGAIALFDSGEDDDTAAPTALDGGQSATAITTPPTLIPLDTLPPPDDPAFTDAPQATSSQDWTLFEALPVPVYPEVPDASLHDVVEYDIATAVDRLGADVPRRSETHYELGNAGFVLDVSIVRDPVRDRYQIVTESRDREQVAIVDVATDTTYVNPGTDNRIEISNDEIIADSTATSINEYFDRLLKGPVRPDTFTAASTRGRALVDIPELGVGREFITVVDGADVPEWQAYAFGPVFEFRDEERPSRLDYHVYVDDEDDIIQVDGVSLLGDVQQLVRHSLTRLDEPPEVDLPADDEATTGPSQPTTPASTQTSDPATTPTSTPTTTPITPPATSDGASG